MSWFSLNKAMGTNYTVDPGDIVSTKTALNQLGYYDVPPHRGIDDWTDDAMFNGIKAFQKDNGLKVDGLMRPGGPTESAISASLAEGGDKPGLGEGETPPPGSGTGGFKWPGSNMPVFTEPPVQYDGRPYWQDGGPGQKGWPMLEGKDPRNGGIIRPPKGPY
ncbi:MAG: peptidoglycan-binding protein [Magnetospirillum sp.]|nr:peptidoglycan-binding protein [Magnetospirillum sp.]